MVAGAVLEIAVAVLLAVVVWELAKSAIDRHLAGQDADDGPGMQPSARAKTLLPGTQGRMAVHNRPVCVGCRAARFGLCRRQAGWSEMGCGTGSRRADDARPLNNRLAGESCLVVCW